MADISVKMGVDGIAQFKQGMTQAQDSVKKIDAALKLNEKQFKATGDAETYMQNKTTQLNTKLQAQQSAVKNAESALKAMKDAGVDPLSSSYQKMETALLNAQSAMLDTQNQLNELGTETADATGKTDALASSLGGLNKKVSLEQVQSAIGSITSGLEAGAKKAADLGKQLWDMIMDSARRADDTATMAQMYGIDLQEFKKMQALVANGMDTSVEAMLGAQDKLKRGIGNGSKDVLEIIKELGVGIREGDILDPYSWQTKDPDKMFWEVGQAIMNMGDAYDKEAAAQKAFGKSWKELVPLFENYKSLEEYQTALDGVEVSSEEATNNAAELNDRVSELEATWTSLKDEIVGAVAPALSQAAGVLSELLGNVLEYLKTPEGKQALEDMGKAVEGLFSDLSKIDPEQVVKGFSDVFTGIVGGLQWLEKNSGTVIGALEAIVIGWGTLKLTGGALDILKLISGITGLASGGTAVAAGTALGSVFTKAASIALKSAPWLAGLAVLSHITDTESNDITDKSGNMTEEGWNNFQQEKRNFHDLTPEQIQAGEWKGNRWAELIFEAGEIVQESAKLWDDMAGIEALARYANTGDREQLARELEGLGYILRTAGDTVAENLQIGENGAIMDENGNRVGYDMPKGEGPVFHKDRRSGEIILDGEDAIREFEQEWGEPAEIPAELKPEDNAAEALAEKVGTVTVPVMFSVEEMSPEFAAAFFGNDGSHANGLFSVPFDGYRAVLHKGEQITPAREVAAANRSFSSNLYVESMYMNNNTDVNGLAARVAAENRRIMSGYGS